MREELEQLLLRARECRGSDVHLVRGLPPKVRVDGSLRNLGENGPLSSADCLAYAMQLTGSEDMHMENPEELDFARTIAGIRCRVNLFRQQGAISAAIRLLSDDIPDLDRLGLPRAVQTLTELNRGIVLVTGETGSGKSTTLAALLDRINHTRYGHILTLEDPVEYIHTPDRCLINQREIGTDTASYATGLRALLREDPDVILIGELRDPETMETALTAAETGHLVFATLHTGSAPEAVDRLADAFPEGHSRQIRTQLANTLMAVLSQQLLPRRDSGRVLACELMMVTPAIRNLIREGKTPQMASALATSAAAGSQTMDNCLISLFQQGQITARTAWLAARDRDYVRPSCPQRG